MSNVPRGWTTDEGRLADGTRWPVLARLPDVLADPIAEQSTKIGTPGGVEHRFDPPQAINSSRRTPNSVQATGSQQPHMFEHGRTLGHRGIPRRESSVLPRSNPFSNPRPRLIDSVAPAVRFLTMVALFTAAGIWIQMMGRHAPAPTRSIEPPTTAAQLPVAPAKNVGDHTVPGPTATGPIETQPSSEARVGRAEGDDFASHNNSAAGPLPVTHPMVTPPHFLISSGSQVPRVRVADSMPAPAAGDSAQGPASSSNDGMDGPSTDNSESDEAAAMARFPGFLMDIPTR
jgi:hypothetical protein